MFHEAPRHSPGDSLMLVITSINRTYYHLMVGIKLINHCRQKLAFQSSALHHEDTSFMERQVLLCHHWFTKFLVGCVPPCQYLGQCWIVGNCTTGNKLQWCMNQNTKRYFVKKKLHLKLSSANWQPFNSGQCISRLKRSNRQHIFTENADLCLYFIQTRQECI